MAFLGVNLSPSYEVALYTLLLLVLWLLVRLVASSMNNLLTFFREGSLTVDPFLNDVMYPCSYWTEKCKRPYQEDRFHLMKAGRHDSSLYGIFDGHGGARASQHCRDNMLPTISSDSDWDNDPQQSLIRSFLRYYTDKLNCGLIIMDWIDWIVYFSVDSTFSAKARSKYWNDGSTAIVAAINNNKVFVANGNISFVVVQFVTMLIFLILNCKSHCSFQLGIVEQLLYKVEEL